MIEFKIDKNKKPEEFVHLVDDVGRDLGRVDLCEVSPGRLGQAVKNLEEDTY
jgi:hypothetical protein